MWWQINIEPLAKVKNPNFGAATVALWERFLLRAALLSSRD
jgi:hypothetical protein